MSISSSVIMSFQTIYFMPFVLYYVSKWLVGGLEIVAEAGVTAREVVGAKAEARAGSGQGLEQAMAGMSKALPGVGAGQRQCMSRGNASNGVGEGAGV